MRAMTVRTMRADEREQEAAFDTFVQDFFDRNIERLCEIEAEEYADVCELYENDDDYYSNPQTLERIESERAFERLMGELEGLWKSDQAGYLREKIVTLRR